MTVVVYRDGVLATDSLSQCSEWNNPSTAQKIWRADDGYLFAITGDLAEGTAAVRKMIGSVCAPVLKHARIIQLIPGSPPRLIVHEEGGEFEVKPLPEFEAWGSGMPPALGALHAGADAREAVRIACLVDPHSGGEVVSYELSQRVEEAA